MKLSKILGGAAAALALMAFANPASAATLETNGVKQIGPVTLDATASSSMVLKDTSGAFGNTCTDSILHGTTTVFTGLAVSGPVTTFTISKCTQEPVTVHAAGTLSVEVIGSGPNGTVRSNGAKWTWPSPFGSLTCTTRNTDIGTLTGTTSGTTKLDINAVLNCGAFLPSAKWETTFNLTGHSIGVVA